MYKYIYLYTYLFIHTYTYTFIYPHIYTYLYMYICFATCSVCNYILEQKYINTYANIPSPQTVSVKNWPKTLFFIQE